MEEEIFICCNCGKESFDEDDFRTDVDNNQDKEELFCEECYDNLNLE